ncbi:MAG: molybdate ABC transporter substrate-binding protein [Magnetococcales bacterium]|nr:molybdate ABC transporter substrate-binding protein [Magnetococcales bacterium]MBF0438417.1 molybdate ABC transporter substrate-binding protein [Magnetococcales bacterium]
MLFWNTLTLFFFDSALANELHIAVAANFITPMKVIAADFTTSTGHKAILSFGSTGKFYSQIKNGAPFELLLAADAATPAKLEQEGLAIPGSRITYAIGKLLLWSQQSGFVDDKGEVLRSGNFAHLALAAPKLSPYGMAAQETLSALNLFAALQPKFVQGENIAQTFQFVTSGNAELGFIALSQVYEGGALNNGSGWIVPANLYKPLYQDGVILLRGQNNPASSAFLGFLQSEKIRAVIQQFGYELK